MDELFVFMIGAAGYTIIEILWRGYTHWTMALTGGVCLLLIYLMNDKLQAGFMIKCLLGSLIITTAELAVGMVVNVALGWKVWDYSAMPLNFKGQICALYSVLWFFMCIPVVRLCDFLKIFIEKV